MGQPKLNKRYSNQFKGNLFIFPIQFPPVSSDRHDCLCVKMTQMITPVDQPLASGSVAFLILNSALVWLMIPGLGTPPLPSSHRPLLLGSLSLKECLVTYYGLYAARLYRHSAMGALWILLVFQ